MLISAKSAPVSNSGLAEPAGGMGAPDGGGGGGGPAGGAAGGAGGAAGAAAIAPALAGGAYITRSTGYTDEPQATMMTHRLH